MDTPIQRVETYWAVRKTSSRVPLLAVAAVLTQLDFNVLWRYFSWSNQTLAMISLWVATAYLLKTHDNKRVSLVTALPATFMSAVSMTYILMAKEGFRLSAGIAYPVGTVFAAALFGVYTNIFINLPREAVFDTYALKQDLQDEIKSME